MKLQEIYSEYWKLNEANLSGDSRSSGKSNWQTYIVKVYDKQTIYTIESDGILVDSSFAKLKDVKKGSKIKITDTKLKYKGKSKFGKIELQSGGDVGYINISKIKKPSNRSSDSIIPGGSNSKEFTPDKLKLMGHPYTSAASLMVATKTALDAVYSDEKYRPIKRYLYDVLSSVSGKKITLAEGFSKSFKIATDYGVATSDIAILSKNFGEVVAGINTLSFNKNAKSVTFPEDISQGLYDFIMIDKENRPHFYSVKSLGGSSTSMANIKFIIDNFNESTLFKGREKEVNVIVGLINDKKGGKTTLTNINDFYNTTLVSERNRILTKINKISKYKAKDLSISELDKWFESMVKNVDVDTFKNTMHDIYENILKKSKATDVSLEKMYKIGKPGSFKNGYLYYPMASYIVKILNDPKKKYAEILNVMLNYSSYVHQFTVNMYPTSFEIKIASFKEMKFRFSYNGMSMAPANRPIGFIKK